MARLAFQPWRLVTVTILLALISLPARAEEPLQVCAFGFNTHDEIEVFRRLLPPEDFHFVDFSFDLAVAQRMSMEQSAAGVEDGPPSWLLDLCRPEIQCDISVYSGEFAARFFGEFGTSLALQQMEEAACQPRCAGLFRHPQEIFLLGCNTLATKDRDERTPAQYFQVLLDHGFDRASAERVVELRYGPLGSSFRESFQRIFMGAPRIYGFSSVAPRGEWTVPRLARYLRSKKDYKRHLERLDGDTTQNRELLSAFRGTALVQVSGMTPYDPRAADRQLICGAYDRTRSLAERLEIVQRMMARGDFLSFLPTIEVFFKRHPGETLQREERRVFSAIQRNGQARGRVMELMTTFETSALKLELANLAHHLGWIPGEELRRLAVTGTRELLDEGLESDLVDVLCEISGRQYIGSELHSHDFPDRFFRKAEGLRLVACLSPADPQITPRVLTGLESSDVWARLWASYALSKRLPLEEHVLLSLVRHLEDESAGVRERLRWILRAQRPLPSSVHGVVRAVDPQLADELWSQGGWHSSSVAPTAGP